MTYSINTLSYTEYNKIWSSIQLSNISFLQYPKWAYIKNNWEHNFISITLNKKIISIAIILYKTIPVISKKYAYIPSGPLIDINTINDQDISNILSLLIQYCQNNNVFAIRLGFNIEQSIWQNTHLKQCIKSLNIIDDCVHNTSNILGNKCINILKESGWISNSYTKFIDFQPKYTAQLNLSNMSIEQIWMNLNQLWRRSLRKTKNINIKIGLADDIKTFYKIYHETSIKQSFTPRGEEYFNKLYAQLSNNICKFYLAYHNNIPIGATLLMELPQRSCYLYGGLTEEGRQLYAGYALQWRMINDTYNNKIPIYDLRGITNQIHGKEQGLLKFKLGSGANIIKNIGEWEYPINKYYYKLFTLYLKYKAKI